MLSRYTNDLGVTYLTIDIQNVQVRFPSLKSTSFSFTYECSFFTRIDNMVPKKKSSYVLRVSEFPILTDVFCLFFFLCNKEFEADTKINAISL